MTNILGISTYSKQLSEYIEGNLPTFRLPLIIIMYCSMFSAPLWRSSALALWEL